MKLYSFSSLAGLALAGALAPLCSPADDSVPVSTGAAETGAYADELFFWGLQWVVPAKGFVQYRTPSDIDGSNGRMSSTTAGFEIAGRFINDQNIFYGAFDYRYTDYRFTDVAAPFSDTQSLHALVRYIRQFDNQWGFFADAVGRMASENDADLSDGCTGSLSAGARYTVSPDMTVYLGLQVRSQLEDSALWLPYLGLEWRINSHWSLNITNGIVATYDVFEDGSLRVDIGCTYVFADYRLRDRALPGGNRTLALKTQEVPLTLSVTKELGKYGYLRGTIGAILYSKYDFEHDENTLRKFETEPAAIFGLEAGFRF